MKIFKTHRTFSEVAEEFLRKGEISLRHRTFVNQKGQVTAFGRWLKEHDLDSIPIRKISSETISDFFVFLAKEKHLDRPTCEKYFLVLRALWRYAVKNSDASVIPFDNIAFPPKGRDCSAKRIPEKDRQILLTEIKRMDPQLYLACMFEYYCAIRPGNELRLLKVKDIDFSAGVVFIDAERAKSGRGEFITMPKQMVRLCREYRIDKANPDFFVFGKKRVPGPQNMSVNMLAFRFNKIRDLLHLSKEYKLYSMKHTGCTALSDAKIVSSVEMMHHFRHTKLDVMLHYIKKHGGIINTDIRDFFPDPLPQPQFVRIKR